MLVVMQEGASEAQIGLVFSLGGVGAILGAGLGGNATCRGRDEDLPDERKRFAPHHDE